MRNAEPSKIHFLPKIDLQSAIDATPPGGTLRLGRRVYFIDRMLIISEPIKIIGEGMYETVITGDVDLTLIGISTKKLVEIRRLSLVQKKTRLLGKVSKTARGECYCLHSFSDKLKVISCRLVAPALPRHSTFNVIGIRFDVTNNHGHLRVLKPKPYETEIKNCVFENCHVGIWCHIEQMCDGINSNNFIACHLDLIPGKPYEARYAWALDEADVVRIRRQLLGPLKVLWS